MSLLSSVSAFCVRPNIM